MKKSKFSEEQIATALRQVDGATAILTNQNPGSFSTRMR
jgi:hypothetical protein